MRLLSEINIQCSRCSAVIQLLHGDLTSIPDEHHADLLVISAFPGDYTPMKGSLMHALYENGLDVAELAKHKAIDMMDSLSCWMSQPLTEEQQAKFHFRQILSYEPDKKAGSPEVAVGNIFRCINMFAFDDDYNVIAMPVLASGKQKVPIAKMLPALLETAIFWLETGIPLDCMKLVLYTQEQVDISLPIFTKVKTDYDNKKGRLDEETKSVVIATPGAAPKPARNPGISPAPQPPPSAATPPSPPKAKEEYDYFISYSHKHTSQVHDFVHALQEKNKGLNIFYDRTSIPTGGLWIKVISEAIQKSKSVICLLSPDYRNSDVCWDEFQCAKAKEYRTKQPVIKTINFYNDAEMPLIMSLYSYIDCSEGDINKLKEAALQLT